MELLIRIITVLYYAGFIDTTVFSVIIITPTTIIANYVPIIAARFFTDYWDNIHSALK